MPRYSESTSRDQKTYYGIILGQTAGRTGMERYCFIMLLRLLRVEEAAAEASQC